MGWLDFSCVVCFSLGFWIATHCHCVSSRCACRLKAMMREELKKSNWRDRVRDLASGTWQFLLASRCCGASPLPPSSSCLGLRSRSPLPPSHHPCCPFFLFCCCSCCYFLSEKLSEDSGLTVEQLVGAITPEARRVYALLVRVCE